MIRFISPRRSRGALFSLAAAAAIAALLALASACSEPPVPSVISHSARVDADNGQIVFVSVALSAPARVAVEYENEFAGKFRTALSETAAEHAVPVVRLRADTVYQYAVGVETGGGGLAYSARGEFKTGALPRVLAAMRSEASGRSSLDLIAADYITKLLDGGLEQRVVIMDALGHAVWEYAIPAAGNLFRVRVQPNGNIAHQLQDCCIVETTPLGEIAGEFAAAGTHHDFLPLEDGRILYIDGYDFAFDDSANGGDAETTALVDALSALDPATGETERVWDPMDFWDLRDPNQRRDWHRDSPDWLHANSLSESGDGGYIVSLRNVNQVISLSPDFKTVRWRLGGPGGDFAFPDPTDRFTAQHAASELPNGNILVFDNQAKLPEAEGGGRYSRALELRLDFENKTAVKAWQFSPTPRMYAANVSSADRLGNGNTLVNFGVSEDEANIPIAIIEADAQGREVFRLETLDAPKAGDFHKTSHRYRAYPGPKSIMGETMLRPPSR